LTRGILGTGQPDIRRDIDTVSDFERVRRMVAGPMSRTKAILYAISTTAGFAVLFFLPAGTFRWWRAWVVLGIVLVGTIVSTLAVMRVNPDVLTERTKPVLQKGQPFADKVLVLLLLVSFTAVIVLVPLDVFRLHLLGGPGRIVSSLGLVLFLAGWWIITLALRANAFAAPVVKHMEERGQTVVDRGVYAVVRHPMYAGAAPFLIGMALWLESWAAALFSIVPMLILAARILVEERFLVEKLPGYDAYRRRVRYRLIPLLW
jgi:protein-S-isoprenylcysteine O-methyltransferase Ste14